MPESARFTRPTTTTTPLPRIESTPENKEPTPESEEVQEVSEAAEETVTEATVTEATVSEGADSEKAVSGAGVNFTGPFNLDDNLHKTTLKSAALRQRYRAQML